MKTKKIFTPNQGDDRINNPENNKMWAIVQTDYGSPDRLIWQEVDKPKVPDNGVLVRVCATSINAADWHLMRGDPFLTRLLFGGILKPKINILGCDVAGRVEAVGKDVTQFQPNDEVFGDLSETGFGAFAEYVCTTEAALALKPVHTSYEEAATIPVAALTALQGLRDLGQIQAGQQVLINGASGGVGSFAVQLAKVFGAEVTAVCSTNKMEMVRSLGADQIIDYSQVDVTQNGQQYDLILDAASYRSVADYLPILTTKGTYVLIGGALPQFLQVMIFGNWISRNNSQQVKCLTVKPNQADLIILRDLIDAGKIIPFIDKRYHLREVPTAISYVEQRLVMGKVAISI